MDSSPAVALNVREGFYVPVRQAAGLIRRQRRTRRLLREQPASVSLEGIRLMLDERWATTTIREGIAGIGFVLACACKRVGAENVIAFEANPELTQVAIRTCAENGFSVRVMNAVLGSEDGDTDFFIHQDFWTSSLDGRLGGTRTTSARVRFEMSSLSTSRPT
jgi:predicted RNA methylase